MGITVNPLLTLPAPPTPLPWQSKVLWYLAKTLVSTGIVNQFVYGSQIEPQPLNEEDPSAHTWRRIQVLIADSQSTVAADDQALTIDLVNYTNGSVDNTWTLADYDQVQVALQAFFGTVAPLWATRYAVYRWHSYVMSFNDYDAVLPDGKPAPAFAITGPPEHIRDLAAPGGSAGTIPPQCSTTITEKTPSRANWGRFYIPGMAGTSLSSAGRITTPVVDTLATAAETLYETLTDNNQLIPVVPTTSVGKQPKRTLQMVTGIRVDDVMDVQRSRRHKFANYRADRP